MRTEKQINASRLNGSHSRGPVTSEGKQRVSQNAVKFGFYSAQIVLAGENREAFNQHAASYYEKFQPADYFEAELVDIMIAARWRQRRMWNIQRDTMDVASRREYNQAPDAGRTPNVLISAGFKTESDNSPTLELIARHEARYERQYLRAHKRLMDIRRNPDPDRNSGAPGPKLVEFPEPQPTEQSAGQSDAAAAPRTKPFFQKQTRATRRAELRSRRSYRLQRRKLLPEPIQRS